VTPGRWSGTNRAAVLLVVLPFLLSLLGCARAVDGLPLPGRLTAVPASVEELGKLIVAEVPSGLPRMPDGELNPPAGPKRVEDIAGYSDDPVRERAVLEDYGYRFGWERFWGTGNRPMTSVFVDEFEGRAGAGTYVEDLARNDAEYYDGVLRVNPPGLPGGCRTLTVEQADADAGLDGPAVFAWCRHGAFSVAVSAVTDSVAVAEKEVRGVVLEQLERLPPG
jgi:hypothetical protein